MDLKTRVAEYNKGVAAFNDKKAHLSASADIMKKQVLEGFKSLSERLGVKVDKNNIKQLLKDEEDKITQALTQGEQFLESHKAVLDAPVTATSIVATPVPAKPKSVPTPTKTASQKATVNENEIMEGDSLDDLTGADDFMSEVEDMFEDDDDEL